MELTAEIIQRFREMAGNVWHGFKRYATEIDNGEVVFSTEPLSDKSILLRMFRGPIEIQSK